MHKEVKQTNTLFWQKAISQITFEHPDQEPLRRGGNNWCKVSMPDPLKWITAWRSKDKMGIFLRVTGENIDFYEQFFSERLDALRAEISTEIRMELPEGKDGWAEAFFLSLRVDNVDTLDPSTENRQLEWYTEYLNKYVNYLRPLVNQLPTN
jgi:hypothetical protein